MKRLTAFTLFCLIFTSVNSLYAVGKGDMAPSLGSLKSLNTKNGGAVELNDYKGRLVLVDFWATWCGPCVRSMPHLVDLHDKFAEKGLVVIGHTDSSSRNLEGFISKHKINFPISVGSNIGKAYGVRGIPSTFLISPSGEILYRGGPSGVNNSMIEKHLKNISPAALMAAKGYPTFEEMSGNKKLKKIQESLTKGSISGQMKKLQKFLEKEKSDEVKGEIEATIKTLDDWIGAKHKMIQGQIESGQAFEAYAKLTQFGKMIGSHPLKDEIKKLKKEVKSSRDYKIGKTFYGLKKKTVRASKKKRSATFMEFSSKYGDSYYGKKAKSLMH